MPQRVRAVVTVAGMAPLERASHVLELGLWADRSLIPTACRAPCAAAALLQLMRYAPERLVARQTGDLAQGSRDRAAPESPLLSSLMAVYREATSHGVSKWNGYRLSPASAAHVRLGLRSGQSNEIGNWDNVVSVMRGTGSGLQEQAAIDNGLDDWDEFKPSRGD